MELSKTKVVSTEKEPSHGIGPEPLDIDLGHVLDGDPLHVVVWTTSEHKSSLLATGDSLFRTVLVDAGDHPDLGCTVIVILSVDL